jgi:predicted DNA-binding protein (UPF0251 family)
MVRPRKVKNIEFEPDVTHFKPQGIPLRSLVEIDLTYDELEAMRLSHLENLSQDEAAIKMGVHQSTFQRTLKRAKEKVTDALVNGKAIKIRGGEYKMPNMDGTGPRSQGLGRGVGRGKGRGRMGGNFAAQEGVCKCPSCGYETTHVRGQPCNTRKCPKCGNLMTRE